jgi:hypothetical protein
MAELTLKEIIKKHLQEGKLDEARAAIRAALQTVAREHQGELLAEFTKFYMDALNEVNRPYAASLKRAAKNFGESEVLDQELVQKIKKAPVQKMSRRK